MSADGGAPFAGGPENGFLRSAARWCRDALAVGLIVLMLAIVAQVALNALKINPVWTFSRPVFLFGHAVTLNSLLDVQWHLLVAVGLLPIGPIWLRNGHVRVDFIYSGLARRWRTGIDLLGNLLFALPFFVLTIPAAWDFTVRAWRTDEGSRNAGLNDLWLIKSALPLGIGLLALGVLIETIRLAGRRG